VRVRLDKIDFRILSVLESEGRIQNQLLAEKVFLSPGACSLRLRRLEQAKLISGYHANIDVSRVCHSVTIFAVIKLSEQGRFKQVQLLKALEKMPEVVDCFEVAGDADFIVHFVCLTLEDYHEHVTELLSDIKLGVLNIESHIMLRHLKSLKRSNLMHLIERSENLE